MACNLGEHITAHYELIYELKASFIRTIQTLGRISLSVHSSLCIAVCMYIIKAIE